MPRNPLATVPIVVFATTVLLAATPPCSNTATTTLSDHGIIRFPAISGYGGSATYARPDGREATTMTLTTTTCVSLRDDGTNNDVDLPMYAVSISRRTFLSLSRFELSLNAQPAASNAYAVRIVDRGSSDVVATWPAEATPSGIRVDRRFGVSLDAGHTYLFEVDTDSALKRYPKSFPPTGNLATPP